MLTKEEFTKLLASRADATGKTSTLMARIEVQKLVVAEQEREYRNSDCALTNLRSELTKALQEECKINEELLK